MSKYQFTYYGLDIPEEGDTVLGKVIEYLDHGIQLQLVEYNGMETVINYRDASKTSRIVKIKNELKKDREYTFTVKSVDKIKGYVELVRLDLTAEDDKKYLSELESYRFLLNLMHSFMIRQNILDLESQNTLLRQTLWSYEFDELMPIFQNIYLGTQRCTDVFPKLDSELASLLEILIKQKLEKEEIVSGTVFFKLMSYESDGVDQIRTFLLKLEDSLGVRVHLKSSPDFYFALNGIDKREIENKTSEIKKLFESFTQCTDKDIKVITRFENIQW